MDPYKNKHPYEKWSRNDFKAAYEEADDLFKKVVRERNDLEKQVEELKAFKRECQMWAQHAITLGKVIAEIIEEDPNGHTIHS